MNTFKRKSLHAAVLAGLGSVGLAGTAQAVNVAPDGLGQVLIYPYYTVRADGGGTSTAYYDTLISVLNTTASTKAVKVRVLEGVRSQEVLDFNLYLSPYDMWTGAITRTTDGAKLVSSDNSCVVPNALFSTAATNTLNQFKNYQYSGTFTDGGATSLDRTREGYIEMIEMGVVTDATAAAAAKHSAGVPANCGYFQTNDTTLGTAIAAPAGGLGGAGILINVPTGNSFSYDAVALSNWQTTTNVYTSSSTLTPTISGGNVTMSHVMTNAGNAISATWGSGADAVTAALMRRAVANEYVLDAGTNSGTDWVITFPGKRNYASVGSGNAAQPFNANYASGQSCDVFTSVYFNREEGTTSTPVTVLPSPLPPVTPVVNSLCYEANVVTFNNSANLGSVNAFNYPIDTTVVGRNGMAVMTFNQARATLTPVSSTTNGVADAAPQAHNGLPMVGFAVYDYANGNVGTPPVLSNYGALQVHKYFRSIGTTP